VDASVRGNVKKIDRLVEAGVDVNAQGEEGWTALGFAMLSGSKKGYKRLLELGADPDSPISGMPAARWVTGLAAQGKDIYWLEQAIAHGADVNLKSELDWSKTAIFLAISGLYEANIDLLIKAGADLDSLSKSGHTPLTFAVMNGQYKLAYRFLELGADWRIKHPSRGFNTVLWNINDHYQGTTALRSGEGWDYFLKIITWLREHGAEMPPGLPDEAGPSE